MIAPISVWELDAGRPKYRAEVPDDRRQQHREHHGEAMCGTHVKQQIGRQHMHDGIGYAETPSRTPKKLKSAAIATASCERIARV